MAKLHVQLDELLGKAMEVRWPEAVALTQGLIAARVGDPARGRLSPDGRILAEPGPLPTVPALAGFLQAKLPVPGTATEPRVPAALRYALVRALGGVTAPPFASVEEFSSTLMRFEQGNRQELLRSLFERAEKAAKVVPRAPLTPATSPAAIAPARGVAIPSWDARPLDGDPGREPAAELLLRPRETRRAPPIERSRETVHRVRATAHSARPPKAKAGRFLTSLALLSLVVAGAVIGAAVFLYADGRPPAALLDAVRPQLERLRDLATDAGAALSGAGTTGSAEAVSATSTAGVSPTPGRALTPDATAGSGGADTIPASAAPPTTADPGPALPGQLVTALDSLQMPVFSPSFAADGSAVFFDDESGADAPALGEHPAGADRQLHVLSVLDDGARNYHPQLSPDRAMVAFDSDRDGVRGVYLSNRAGGNIHRVSGDGYAAVPTWSPNGRRLAFIKAEPDNARVWNVWLLDLPSRAMRRVTGYRVGQPWGASWFPDSRRICYSREDRLIVLDTHTGETRIYRSPRSGALVQTPVVSPDGRAVIFQLYRQGAWLLDFDDRSMRQVLDDPFAEEFAWSPDGSRVAFHSRTRREWGIRIIGPKH